MAAWSELLGGFLRLEQERLHTTADAADLLVRQQAFQQWAATAARWAIGTVTRALEERADQLRRHTGAEVLVDGSRSNPSPPSSEPRVALILAPARVDVYATCQPGQYPALHLLASDGEARRVALLSLPGAIVTPAATSDVALVTSEGQITSAPALAERACELLLGVCQRRARSKRRRQPHLPTTWV